MRRYNGIEVDEVANAPFVLGTVGEITDACNRWLRERDPRSEEERKAHARVKFVTGRDEQ